MRSLGFTLYSSFCRSRKGTTLWGLCCCAALCFFLIFPFPCLFSCQTLPGGTALLCPPELKPELGPSTPVPTLCGHPFSPAGFRDESQSVSEWRGTRVFQVVSVVATPPHCVPSSTQLWAGIFQHPSERKLGLTSSVGPPPLSVVLSFPSV